MYTKEHMEHIKLIMQRMGYVPSDVHLKHETVLEKDWKPTWAGLAIGSLYDLLCFTGRVIVIFLIGIVAVKLLLQTTAQSFLQYAPQVCKMITTTPV